MTDMERRYTTEEVAKKYQCPPASVTRWVREGRITAINLGSGRRGPYVFRKEDLADFEQRNEVGRKGTRRVGL